MICYDVAILGYQTMDNKFIRANKEFADAECHGPVRMTVTFSDGSKLEDVQAMLTLVYRNGDMTIAPLWGPSDMTDAQRLETEWRGGKSTGYQKQIEDIICSELEKEDRLPEFKRTIDELNRPKLEGDKLVDASAFNRSGYAITAIREWLETECE